MTDKEIINIHREGIKKQLDIDIPEDFDVTAEFDSEGNKTLVASLRGLHFTKEDK